MRILIAAGGTGGHLQPALATADRLRVLQPDVSVLFLSTGRTLGETFFEGTTYGREPLFPGLEHAPRRFALATWLAGLSRARAVVRDFEPDVVAGFGGYPTLLAAVAALGGAAAGGLRLLLGRGGRARRAGDAIGPPAVPPLVLLEQNAVAGGAVRVLSGVAEKILLSFDAARSSLPASARVALTGNPLTAEFEAEPPAVDPAAFGLARGKQTIAVLGGSQGARGVNHAVLGARAAWRARHPEVQLYLVSGALDHADVTAAIAAEPEPATVVVPFERRMRALYEIADVVVARGGGTTLAEVARVGRPAVLVPYPHHRDGHQFANAALFESAGAARVVREGADASLRLGEAVSAYLGDEAERRRAGACARSLGRAGAADACARQILAVAQGAAP